ncbi:hypothetical protein [Ornithinicoccus halotolerans]|uniref:hypothetical protein n=1 Tax=Ornithinicoccus halotolerans TaxID=1748220 RepID=UPI0018861A10|nr:hypothetical protein [Ornithinicoccus halotolerans]
MTDPTSLPNFPPPPEERPLRGRVLDALQDLQFGPDLDSQGDVRFTAKQQQLFVRCLTGGQVDVMRVYGQWRIAESVPDDLMTRLNACNDVTLGVNLVKAGIASGNLVLSVEQVIGQQEDPKAKLQIATGMLLQAVALWHKNAVAKAKRQQALARGEEPPPPEEGQQAAGPWLSEAAPRRRGQQDQGGDTTGEGEGSSS